MSCHKVVFCSAEVNEMIRKTSIIKKAFFCAFPYTIPVFAGSVEFVAVTMLLGTFEPVQALLMTLMINARHLFYGISMLDKYRGQAGKSFI